MDREFLGRHRSVNSVSVGLGLSLPVHRSQSTTLEEGGLTRYFIYVPEYFSLLTFLANTVRPHSLCFFGIAREDVVDYRRSSLPGRVSSGYRER